MNALLLAIASLAGVPIDTVLYYDGVVIPLPQSICVAAAPIQFLNNGEVLAIPNGIYCNDLIYKDGFDG